MKNIPFSTWFYAGLLLIVPLGFSSNIMDESMLPKYLLLGIILLITLVIGLLKKSTTLLRPTLPDLFFLLFLLSYFIALPQAINFSDALFESFKALLILLSYLLLRAFLQEEKEGSFTAISRFACYASFITLLFCLKELYAATQLKAALSASVYLVKGLSGHKNLLSNWFLLLFPLTLIGFLKPAKTPKWLLWGALIIQLGLIAILRCRASYLGVLAGSVCFAILYPFSKRKNKSPILSHFFAWTWTGFVFLFIALIFFSTLPDKALQSLDLAQGSFYERTQLWLKTIAIIKKEGLLGIGPGNWKIWLPSEGLEGLYRAKTANTVFVRPHNDYLWIYVENGLIGILSYFAFIGSLIYFSLKALLKQKGANKSILLILLSGLIAYLSLATADFPKERIEHQLAFAFLAALLVHFSSPPAITASLELKKLPLYGSAFLCLFALFIGFKRMQSEKKVKTVLSNKDQGNYPLMAQNAALAENYFYRSDNNGYPISWYEGIAQFHLQQHELAFANFQKAYQLHPFDFNVLNNLGTSYFVKGNYQEAIRYYLMAITINQQYTDAILNTCAAYINLKQPKEALKWLQKTPQNNARTEQLQRLIQQQLAN
jgi:O-antigen ligase